MLDKRRQEYKTRRKYSILLVIYLRTKHEKHMWHEKYVIYKTPQCIRYCYLRILRLKGIHCTGVNLRKKGARYFGWSRWTRHPV